MTNNKILITGAAGWLGQNIINVLINGIDIYPETQNIKKKYSIDVFIQKNEYDQLYSMFGDEINYYFGNILSQKDCNNFTKNKNDAIIFHLVGIIHPSRIQELYKINLEGTKNIFKAAIDSSCKRIISMSSNSPIGCNKNTQTPFNEESEYNPYLNYGKSKMLMEQFIEDISKKKLIETVIFRGTWFYGPFQPDRQNFFFYMIKNGKVPLVGKGNNLRSMSNTENLAYAFILAITNSNIVGKKYWIADEKPYTYYEIISTIRSVLKNEFNEEINYNFLKLPNITSNIAYIIDNFFQSVNLYNSKIHVLSELNKNIFCSIENAKKDLCYFPKINLKNGLLRNFIWTKNKYNSLNFKS